MKCQTTEQEITVTLGQTKLFATLGVPLNAVGAILFAHGSGSSRHSSRNRYVARVLQESGFATLLMDLLTLEEEQLDARTGHLRFDIGFLANRLVGATDWSARHADVGGLPIGYFGASTGAAAALVAAARRPRAIRAVVSRGGRPDLAGDSLNAVRAPTLLIVGSADTQVLALNRQAFTLLAASEKRLEILPGASHLFEEAGALERVAALACVWFGKYLTADAASKVSIGADKEGPLL